MRTTFTLSELTTLRNQYASLETAPVSCLPKFRALFDGCTDDGLRQLATANIKFVSALAVNACVRRGLV